VHSSPITHGDPCAVVPAGWHVEDVGSHARPLRQVVDGLHVAPTPGPVGSPPSPLSLTPERDDEHPPAPTSAARETVKPVSRSEAPIGRNREVIGEG
jgi:hypothetical protein